MTRYGVWPSGAGWMAGPLEPRKRGETLTFHVRPAHHASTPEKALRAALAAHGPNGTTGARKTPRSEPARLRDGLTKDGRRVLDHLKERGSITKREAAGLGVWNLPGRIYDIRWVHGRGSVETVMEPNGNGGRHGRYYWRG